MTQHNPNLPLNQQSKPEAGQPSVAASELRPVQGTPTLSPLPQPITPATPPPGGIVAPPTTTGSANSVQGQIVLDHGLPASGVTVRIYNRGFGGADTLLGTTQTNSQGAYTCSYTASGAVNLDVRVVGADGKTETSLAAPQYNPGTTLTLNLVAPASIQPLAAEYERLHGNLSAQLGTSVLGNAVEDTARQDLTLLSQQIGWDPRLISLAATANALSTTTSLPEDTLYALFRAGLPTDAGQLAWVDAQAVQKALAKTNAAGITNYTDQQIAAAGTAFTNYARTVRLAAKSPGTASSYGDLLNNAGLGNQQTAFADLVFSHPASGSALWQQAQALGLTQTQISALQLQGKLAYLTLNNAGLTAELQKEIGSGTPDQLVNSDLYLQDGWKTRLNTLAGNNTQTLDTLIPPAFTGASTADRLDAYSADLARKVRLSFPTQIVGRMLTTGALQLGQGHDASSVQTFLQNAAPLGFALGRTPVDRFVRDNQARLFPNATPDQVATKTQSVKLLHRLYQTSPTNESLQVLLAQGFTSAHDIAAVPYEDFLNRYGKLFPSQEEAILTYRKAQQITVVTYNFFAGVQQLASSPAIYTVSAAPDRRQQARTALIEAYPTLNTLFGSLDYCECEECRSVLSPAAYLVDLLQFLDPNASTWTSFLNYWQSQHGSTPYPFTTQEAWKHAGQPPNTQITPFAVLTERRPDLPYLPLTCENTNTALPYIDLVNEILEYYIVNKGLDANAVHDTGDATTPELLAEPQNILPAAYDMLKKALYPLTLPFDLWLETVRQFFAYYQMPFWKILDVFRPSDTLFAPTTSPLSYYRSSIFAEYLGIAPSEYALYTSANPLANWSALYGYATESAALAAPLTSAPTLSQSLGVSYKDLIALLRTGFMNPQLNTLSILYKLGIDIDDVLRYKGQAGYQPFSATELAAFQQRLSALTVTFSNIGFDAGAWLDSAWSAGNFNTVLVLADPNATGDFTLTTLQYANGTAAENLVYLKLNLFVRLWQCLGWSMDETDRALQVFLPSSSSPLSGSNLGAALTTALIYMAHLNTLLEQSTSNQLSRLQLLTLWSDIATTGASPLYAQLFLTHRILQSDAVFDHPLGLYLRYLDPTTKQYLPFTWDSTKPENPKTGNVPLQTHLTAIQAALGLSGNEIGLILTDAGKTLSTEPLTLSTLSLLYRYGLLAQVAGLTVSDLIALKGLSGLNPFTPLSPNPLTAPTDPQAQLAADYPLVQTLRFVDIVKAVQGSGFQVADVNYLLRQRFDPVGPYRPDPNALLSLVQALATGIRGIRDNNAVPAAAGSLTDDLLRQKLALALPADVVETFFAMWNGTVAYTVTQANVAPANKLDPASLTQQPEIQVIYDDVTQTQQLTYQGVLFDTQKTQIESANTSPVLAAMLVEVEAQAQTFFTSYLQPFLSADDFTQLFTPLLATMAPADQQTQMQARRLQLAQAFLPFLQQKLTGQFVVQSMATNLGVDPILTGDLLTDISLLADPTDPPAAGQPVNPLLGAFVASAERGVSVTYSTSAAGPGATDPTTLSATVDTTSKPAGTLSALFEGYLQVPTDGPYRFFVDLGKQSASAELRVADQPDPLLHMTAAADNAESSEFTTLQAGVPYHLVLTATNLGGGDASLLIQGENLPKGPLSRLTLYSAAAVGRVARARVLLAKVFQLIQTLGLSAGEVHYLLTHAADFAHLNLTALPTQPADDTAAGAIALFSQFLRLAAYASLKGTLAPNANDLIDLFAHARLNYPLSSNATQVQNSLFSDLCQRVANLTRRDAATVSAAARLLGFTTSATPTGSELLVVAPDLVQEQGLQRLWSALQVVGALNVPVSALQRWLTPTPDADVAQDLRNTVKALYQPADWQRVAQPIFDTLRKRQRDALVAYIMQQQGFTLSDQLFEYFLIDPGMEPVVQTSRLLLAISSVQTFIQRCLLNLEQEVSPLAINAQQWEWMKHYRVWEANRKIWLWPENWLEPEFRDDKTNLFLTFESALLQGDVSDELASDAFYDYLQDLEKLARLDLVTMYAEELPDPSDNILHLIGRTHNTPHKYYYRTYSHKMWTPWTPVNAQIQSDHVVAIKWRQRLHLFWITFVVKGDPNAVNSQESYQTMGNNTMAPPAQQVDMQLNWSEYFQGSWSSHQASDLGNVSETFTGGFDPKTVFIYANKGLITGADGTVSDGAVYIYLSDPVNQTFTVLNKNSQPQSSKPGAPAPGVPYSSDGSSETRYTDTTSPNGELTISYVESIEVSTTNADPQVTAAHNSPILQQGDSYSLLFSSVPPQFTGPAAGATNRYVGLFDSSYVIGLLTRPFFYQDGQNTFFVEPTMTETQIDAWEWWTIGYPWGYRHFNTDQWWTNLPLQAAVPQVMRPPVFDASSLYQLKPVNDWAVNKTTILTYKGQYVGPNGGLTLTTLPTLNAAPGSGIALTPVRPGLGNTLTGGIVSILGENVLHVGASSGLTLVNKSGLTSGALKSVLSTHQLNSAGLAANKAQAQ